MKNKQSDPPVTRSEFLREINIVKSDVGELKSDVGKLKSDVGTLQNNVGSLNDNVGKMANEIVKIQFELKTFATKEDLRNTEFRILNAIDAFARKGENYDTKAVFHDSRINNHEERITKLEAASLK